MAKAAARKDSVSVGLDAMQNPTKLRIIFLLMKHPRLTVTQMSKDIGVSKANLYHFAGQMVKDGLLTEPEVVVKGNYVEKYYTLKWGALESINAVERKIKSLKPEAQREILQTFLVSATLVSRMLAEELGKADRNALADIHSAYRKDMINTTYLIIPDEVYAGAVKKLNKVVKEILELYRGKEMAPGQNRIVILGVPQMKEREKSG